MDKELKTLESVFEQTVFDPRTLIGALVYADVFLVIAFLVARVIRGATRRAIEKGRSGSFDYTPVSFLGQLAQIGVYVVAFGFYAHLIPQLRSLGTALLAGVSIASVVVGFAAQSTLGNILAGVLILIYRPFRAGDRIKVALPDGPDSGVVEDVTLGYTILKTFDNRRIVVPNSILTTQPSVNLSMLDPMLIIEVPFTIGYSSDIEKAREILAGLADKHPKVRSVENCPVTEHGSFGVKLLLRVWCANSVDGRDFLFDIMEQAKNAFDANGIEIPYPYTNVVFTNALPAEGRARS